MEEQGEEEDEEEEKEREKTESETRGQVKSREKVRQVRIEVLAILSTKDSTMFTTGRVLRGEKSRSDRP